MIIGFATCQAVLILLVMNCTPIPPGYREWVGQHRLRFDEIENELKTDSLNYKLLAEQGAILNEVAMFEKALPKLIKSININSNYKEAYVNIGNSYRGLEKYDSSFKSFENALRIDSSYGLAYFNLGALYWDIGEEVKAIEFTKKAITKDPSINQGYYNLACFYSIKNKKESAIVFLRDAIEKGFGDCLIIKNDKDLENIRDEDGFIKILSDLNCN